MNWRTAAACIGAGEEFVLSEDLKDRDLAVRVLCRDCPVRDRCLAFALDHDERWGVWGGHDFGSALDRARAAAGAPTVCEHCGRPRHPHRKRFCSEQCTRAAQWARRCAVSPGTGDTGPVAVAVAGASGGLDQKAAS